MDLLVATQVESIRHASTMWFELLHNDPPILVSLVDHGTGRDPFVDKKVKSAVSLFIKGSINHDLHSIG